jgi:hypothetical protein
MVLKLTLKAAFSCLKQGTKFHFAAMKRCVPSILWLEPLSVIHSTSFTEYYQNIL